MSDQHSHWLDIIGVTENGIGALGDTQMQLIKQAKTIFGAKRFVEKYSAQPAQTIQVWTSPFSKTLENIHANHGEPTVVLASGDPNWYGIGSTLSAKLDPIEFDIHPAPSAFQLAAAHMGWPLQNISTISLHGRSAFNLVRYLAPGARILALTSNRQTLIEVANILCQRGYNKSTINALENLGGEHQRQASICADRASEIDIGDFYTLAVDCVIDQGVLDLPRTPGLPDNSFAHDGQITKRHVRSITLCALAPQPHDLLWDIGAGSGSIGIEWMRSANGAHAICFEKSQSRCDNIVKNKDWLGVPDLQVVCGEALYNISDYPRPDAIFIGGDVSNATLFNTCWNALRPGGRLVANAVTLKAQLALTSRQEKYGGELTMIAISRQENIGTRAVLRPNLPVMQWQVKKPQQGSVQ